MIRLTKPVQKIRTVDLNSFIYINKMVQSIQALIS